MIPEDCSPESFIKHLRMQMSWSSLCLAVIQSTDSWNAVVMTQSLNFALLTSYCGRFLLTHWRCQAQWHLPVAYLHVDNVGLQC